MPEFLASLKASLHFTDQDQDLLIGSESLMKMQVKQVIEEVVEDGAAPTEFKAGLASWLDCLLSPPWDQSYYAKRVEISLQHSQLNLTPSQVQTGMAAVIQALMLRTMDLPASKSQATMISLQKISSIDLAIMLRANRERHVTDVQERRKSRRDHTLAALGTLTSGLAHEIRNPLNAAQLQLALVERELKKAGDAVGNRGRRASLMVKSELHRLAGLLNDFIAFARPLPLNRTKLTLGALCSEVVETLGAAAAAGQVSILQTITDVEISADRVRIEQVLIHLVQNAIEAAGVGGQVYLHCLRDGDSARVEIRDSGPGFPEDVDLFEPFASTKEAGTGLGLPIAQRGITDHGGSLTTAREGDQTVVSVELPLRESP